MSAGGGPGSAIALALAREGATVAVSNPNVQALEDTVSRVHSAEATVQSMSSAYPLGAPEVRHPVTA
jgi:3-oxoacyl-[acyl-carrier protein] reductase